MRPLAPPRRLQGVSTLGDVLRLLATAENQRPVSAAQLADLRARFDVTMIRKPPTSALPGARPSVASADVGGPSAADLAQAAPLIAAVLAGHANRLEMTEAEGGASWLLLREPIPSGAVSLREALGRSDAAGAARLLTSTLRAMMALHERGVVLNEGARSALQMVVGSRPLVGWHTDWATVFGSGAGAAGPGEQSGESGPLRAAGEVGPVVICATDEEDVGAQAGSVSGCGDVYPARDLLWLLSDAPSETQRLAGSVVTCLVLDGGEGEGTAQCALVPLSELHEGPMAAALPRRWQASAVPVGGAGVAGLRGRSGMLHRATWAIQKVAAAALAVHDNGSAWARKDLEDAVAELWREAGLRSRKAVVVRSIGSRPVVVLVGGAVQDRSAGAVQDRSAGAVVVRYDGPLPDIVAPETAPKAAAEVSASPASSGASEPSVKGDPLAALVRAAQGNAIGEYAGPGQSADEEGPSRVLADVLEFFGSIDAPEQGEEEDSESEFGDDEAAGL